MLHLVLCNDGQKRNQLSINKREKPVYICNKDVRYSGEKLELFTCITDVLKERLGYIIKMPYVVI